MQAPAPRFSPGPLSFPGSHFLLKGQGSGAGQPAQPAGMEQLALAALGSPLKRYPSLVAPPFSPAIFSAKRQGHSRKAFAPRHPAAAQRASPAGRALRKASAQKRWPVPAPRSRFSLASALPHVPAAASQYAPKAGQSRASLPLGSHPRPAGKRGASLAACSACSFAAATCYGDAASCASSSRYALAYASVLLRGSQC